MTTTPATPVLRADLPGSLPNTVSAPTGPGRHGYSAAGMPAEPAPVLRATSQYVLAFRAVQGWTLSDTLDDLITAAQAAGLIVAGSHNKGGLASLVLRFPTDAAAVAAAFDLSADVHAPLAGIVTGLGVNRREVSL